MKYRSEIDGLRAFAVIPVVLFHAGFQLFGGGFVGVDIFFVISGYLITTIIVDEIEKGRFSIAVFYERRARRILPALLFVIVCSTPFAVLWMAPQQLQDYARSVVSIGLFVSNVFFWRESDYFSAAAEEKPLLHTWSLSVEEQYYLLFPVFMIMAWRFGRQRVFLAVLLFAISSFFLSELVATRSISANFYLSPTRAWELFAGSLAALYLIKRGPVNCNILALMGLCGIILSVILFDKNTPFPGRYALLPVVSTALIVVYGHSGTFVAKLLSARIMVGVGLVSYSAYLWHQPLFAFARIKGKSEPGSLFMALLCVLSFVLAFLSWKYVEARFRMRVGRSEAQRVLSLSLVCLSVLVLVGALGQSDRFQEYRYDSKVLSMQKIGMELFESQVEDCWDKYESNPDISVGCLLGNIESREIESLDFALLGDSHAATLLHGLNKGASEYGLTGVNYSFRGCAPLAEAIPSSINITNEKCVKLKSSFFNNLSGSSIPDTVIVSARWTLLLEKKRFTNDNGVQESGGDWVWEFDGSSIDYREGMGLNIKESILRILRSNRKVIIVYPIPEMGWDVPGLLAGYLDSNGRLAKEDGSVSHELFKSRNSYSYDVLDSLGEFENLVRIYPERMFCDSTVTGRCIAHLDENPLYFDDDHLSNFAAEKIVKSVFSILADSHE